MIKYDGYYITFQEVPNEVSLTFTITNCPHKCEGCHSPWLRNNIGRNLGDDIHEILDKYSNMITCVCFMGEGNDIAGILNLLPFIDYRKAIYTGLDSLEDWMLSFDYIKIGGYNEQCGALDSPETNQRFYKNEKGSLLDITNFFIKKGIDL